MTAKFPLKYPTDHHEDRWNRLSYGKPLADLSFEADASNPINDYQSLTKSAPVNKKGAQADSIKAIKKQEEQLKKYTDQITRQFEEIKRFKVFPNAYYRYPVSNLPEANHVVVNSNLYPATIQSYEERVRSLEREMNLRERDTQKMSDMIKLLMEENSYLKHHIAMKNKEIAKVLETIGLNDGEIVHELNHRLGLVTEENRILIAHNEELKSFKAKAERALEEKQDDLEKVNEDFSAYKARFNEAMAREGVLTHNSHTLEIKYTKTLEKVKQLEAALDEATTQLENLQDKNNLATAHLSAVKQNMEDLDDRKTLENGTLAQQNAKFSNENEELKRIIELKNKNLETQEKELKKARRDLESIKLENEEYSQRMQTLKNEVSIEAHNKKLALKSEKELEQQNENYLLVIQKLQEELRTIETNYKISFDAAEEDYQAKCKKYERRIKKLKAKMSEALEDKDDKITQLTRQIEKLNENLNNLNIQNERNNQENATNTNKPPSDAAVFEKSNVFSSPQKKKELRNTDHSEDYTIDPFARDLLPQDINSRVNNEQVTVKPFDTKEPKTDQFRNTASTNRTEGISDKKGSRNNIDNFLSSRGLSIKQDVIAPSHREVQKIVDEILNKSNTDERRLYNDTPYKTTDFELRSSLRTPPSYSNLKPSNSSAISYVPRFSGSSSAKNLSSNRFVTFRGAN